MTFLPIAFGIITCPLICFHSQFSYTYLSSVRCYELWFLHHLLNTQVVFWVPFCPEGCSVIIKFSTRWWENSFHVTNYAFPNWKELQELSINFPTSLIQISWHLNCYHVKQPTTCCLDKIFLPSVPKSWCYMFLLSLLSNILDESQITELRRNCTKMHPGLFWSQDFP